MSSLAVAPDLKVRMLRTLAGERLSLKNLVKWKNYLNKRTGVSDDWTSQGYGKVLNERKKQEREYTRKETTYNQLRLFKLA